MGSQGYGYSSSPDGFTFLKNERPTTAGMLRVMPCTSSQLHSAREHRDSFFIRDMELNQVTVVGLIRGSKLTSTQLIYSLDDMTGPPLDVKQWLNIEDFNMNHCFIPSGTYVKVVGGLRSYQHHRSMVAFNIRRLDDFNEITSHILEVIHAHRHSESSPYSVINTSHASDPATIGFTAKQRQVYTRIKCCLLKEGISMQCLRNSLKSLSSYDIRTCLQFLLNEGHIFSTIDEYHYKCTTG